MAFKSENTANSHQRQQQLEELHCLREHGSPWTSDKHDIRIYANRMVNPINFNGRNSIPGVITNPI